MSKLGTVLIVDDEDELRVVLTEILSEHFEVVSTKSGAEALQALAKHAFDAVLTDLNMPGMTGLELLAEIKAKHPDLPIILITARADKQVVVEALRGQAHDFFDKPVEYDKLTKSLAHAVKLRKHARRVLALQDELDEARRALEVETAEALPAEFRTYLTADTATRGRLNYCAAIAKTPLPVLIVGETGTGKDVLARAIHAASGRTGPFVAANVGGMDDALLADTLFGHVSGAFTHGDKKRSGLIESAEKGTLFLDEIGDLSAASQVKLLRLLENGEYYPLGSDAVKKSQARIVAATHKDVEVMVAKGQFRSDLYFRLKSHLVALPALRERKGDLPLLVSHFLDEAAKELGKQRPPLPKELEVLLDSYHFPGNVRELKGMVYDALSRHTGGVLSLDGFKAQMQGAASGDAPVNIAVLTDAKNRLLTLKEAEDFLVEEALKRSQGNQTVAARMLGLTRQALNKRLMRAEKKKAG